MSRKSRHGNAALGPQTEKLYFHIPDTVPKDADGLDNVDAFFAAAQVVRAPSTPAAFRAKAGLPKPTAVLPLADGTNRDLDVDVTATESPCRVRLGQTPTGISSLLSPSQVFGSYDGDAFSPAPSTFYAASVGPQSVKRELQTPARDLPVEAEVYTPTPATSKRPRNSPPLQCPAEPMLITQPGAELRPPVEATPESPLRFDDGASPDTPTPSCLSPILPVLSPPSAVPTLPCMEPVLEAEPKPLTSQPAARKPEAPVAPAAAPLPLPPAARRLNPRHTDFSLPGQKTALEKDLKRCNGHRMSLALTKPRAPITKANIFGLRKSLAPGRAVAGPSTSSEASRRPNVTTSVPTARASTTSHGKVAVATRSGPIVSSEITPPVGADPHPNAIATQLIMDIEEQDEAEPEMDPRFSDPPDPSPTIPTDPAPTTLSELPPDGPMYLETEVSLPPLSPSSPTASPPIHPVSTSRFEYASFYDGYSDLAGTIGTGMITSGDLKDIYVGLVASPTLCSGTMDVGPNSQSGPHRLTATTLLFYVVEGEGEVKIDKIRFSFKPGAQFQVPCGTRYCIYNRASVKLRMSAVCIRE